MCGIAGFIDSSCSSEEAAEQLRGMLSRMVHRGPDGEGLYVAPENGLAMGARWISITGSPGGEQPSWNEDHTVGVVLDGEIYNAEELRANLRSHGHRFQAESDAEVLAHQWEEAGPLLVDRLRGRFSFAVVDLRREQLLLVRDHFGQKPLYYAGSGGRFAFASELKSLLTLPWMESELDPEAFLDYAAWLSLPPGRTHLQGIGKMPAGHRLLLSLDAPGAPKPEEYWHYRLDRPAELFDLEAAAEELDAALSDSVRAHLRSNEPSGVLLSGGVNSRAIAAYAQDHLAEPMQTFSVGFSEPDSEVAETVRLAKEIGARHHAMEIGPDDLSAKIGQVAWHLDEPVGDPSAFAALAACELAREHVKVVLSGEGGDELFGGHAGRYHGMLHTLRRSDGLRWLGAFLPEGDAAARPTKWQRLLARSQQRRSEESLALRMEGFPGDLRKPRGLTGLQRRRLRMRTGELTVFRRQRDMLSSLLMLDVEWQLAESLLQKADKMSMAASMELRMPLLDVRVAELAARIDSSLKLPPGGPGKLVLRTCLARKLNEPPIGQKRDYPVPLESWLRGSLREEVEASLFDHDSACLSHLDHRLLRVAWEDFQRGEWEGGRVFYGLWLYNVWAHGLATAPEMSII